MLAPFAYPPIDQVLPVPQDGRGQYTLVLQSVVTRVIALAIGCTVALLLRFLGKLGLRAAVSPAGIEHPNILAVHGESAPALSSAGLYQSPNTHAQKVHHSEFVLHLEPEHHAASNGHFEPQRSSRAPPRSPHSVRLVVPESKIEMTKSDERET